MAFEQIVEKEVFLPASTDEVWAALTVSDRLAAWFGAEAWLELRSGGRATFRWPNGTTRYAAVEIVEPSRLLILRWLPFVVDAHGSKSTVPATKLRFQLSATSKGTRLQVTESAPGSFVNIADNDEAAVEGRRHPGSLELRTSVVS